MDEFVAVFASPDHVKIIEKFTDYILIVFLSVVGTNTTITRIRWQSIHNTQHSGGALGTFVPFPIFALTSCTT
jgi:hypothetical protein